jgi:hypothetical protein
MPDGAATIAACGAVSAARMISAITAADTWSMRAAVGTTRGAVGGWSPAANRTFAWFGVIRSSQTRARTPGWEPERTDCAASRESTRRTASSSPRISSSGRR